MSTKQKKTKSVFEAKKIIKEWQRLEIDGIYLKINKFMGSLSKQWYY
jgi:hypothetical protein